MMKIRERHFVRTTLAPFTLLRHLEVELAELGVTHGALGVGGTLLEEQAMILLGLAPGHLAHIRGGVRRDPAIAGETVDELAHLAADPHEHGVQLDAGSFSASSCHRNLLITV